MLIKFLLWSHGEFSWRTFWLNVQVRCRLQLLVSEWFVIGLLHLTFWEQDCPCPNATSADSMRMRWLHGQVIVAKTRFRRGRRQRSKNRSSVSSTALSAHKMSGSTLTCCCPERLEIKRCHSLTVRPIYCSAQASVALHVTIIHRCFVSKQRDLLVKAFITYARPILEYNSPLWSLTLKKDIISIESVQRKFTRRISGMSGLSYHSRLKALNLESLELRRLRADLLLAYKILFGLLRVNKWYIFYSKKPVTINVTQTAMFQL